MNGTHSEGLFGSAIEGAVGECARLIAFVAVGVKRHAPDLLAAEVSQPTEVEWYLAYPVEVLAACLVANVKESPGRGVGLDEGVDVAERSVESDVQSGECAKIALLGVRSDALLCLLPHSARDRRPSGMRIMHPDLTSHAARYLGLSTERCRSAAAASNKSARSAPSIARLSVCNGLLGGDDRRGADPKRAK